MDSGDGAISIPWLLILQYLHNINLVFGGADIFSTLHVPLHKIPPSPDPVLLRDVAPVLGARE